ncbi:MULTISPECIES: VWA domain-containing protein [unclassified Streptomyces]|uniref:VWA domain-containing protein n=1 Tax=unclassified Streptomyces TaxID=2593676 RepID=UPI00037762A8|nr:MULTISPECIES: VWA domain-containing protein [unclassified Streptomyces]MYT32663.1 VWA domain-containing protein [Streptomyces sp. SID8354]
MAAQLHNHLPPAPPALSETEWATARWEDDGGNLSEPRPTAQRAHWLRIAAALSARLPELTEREDILVTCEHGTRSGAPAAFYPTLAQLEIDAALFAPLPPATIRPARPGDEDRYPAAWGAFVHEAAHAAHSHWHTPPALRGTALDEAGQILEESRAERAHLGRRPGDRRYLRSAVHALILNDFTSQTPSDRWQAALAAGLLLARRDAGILDPDETQILETTLTGILGPDLLQTLTGIWTAAHATADEDGAAMMEHARAWCAALGAESVSPPPAPDSSCGRRGELAEVIGKTVAQVQANEAAQAAVEAKVAAARATRAQAKANQAAQRRQAAKTAEKVFSSNGRPFTPGKPTKGGRHRSPVTGTRPPEADEKTAAGRLARALRAAAYRERTTTVTASAAPPGRLNMRQALARDAQRAAGATPTAAPWTRTLHRPTPTPPLRVGIAVDVSGSMHRATAPIASAAWILAKATALTDPDSRTATVAYHRSITAITAPGRTPTRVTQFNAKGGGHLLAEATDALTAALDLDRPGTGRLLVIASDGYYNPTETALAATRITALRKTGCAILWLAFAPGPRPLPGTTLLELTDPAQATTAIGKAATAALAAANT